MTGKTRGALALRFAGQFMPNSKSPHKENLFQSAILLGFPLVLRESRLLSDGYAVAPDSCQRTSGRQSCTHCMMSCAGMGRAMP